jgi:hypothetical protein
MADYLLGTGTISGVNSRLTGAFDPGLYRPFIETDPNSPDNGRPCAQLQVGWVHNARTGEPAPRYEKRRIDQWQALGVNSPVFNSVVFTREDWVQIDRAVQRAQRLPLTAYSDLRAASTLGGFDAWSKLAIEYSAIGEAGEVVKALDVTSPARDDTPAELIRSSPLPVIYGEFSYPQRLLDIARAAGRSLDTIMFEQVTRRLWEAVEKCYIGTEAGFSGQSRTTGPFPITGSNVEYGLTNYPGRITKTDLTAPTGSNPEAVNQDLMEMLETMRGYGFQGPFVLYYSTPYGPFINGDYFRSGGTSAVMTLKQRLMMNEEVADIRRLDYLTSGYQLILVDYGSGQISAVDGMRPRPLQWSERGGQIQKFLIMAIQTQIFRTQYSGVAPMLHATTS